MAGEGTLSSSKVSAAGYLEAFDYLYEQGMTDGLPVVPPTEDLVLRMVEGAGRPADELIARVPPSLGEATVEKIAVNGVMAGCLPEYMPVIVAAVEAMVEEPFDLYGIQTTTNPAAVCVIVNGPIRQRLNINCGSGCLAPGWRANATIGRAIRLILLNLGGATPGDVDKATQGSPGKYGMCFGENEEESPWTPLHVERGFRPDQSCVTVVPPQSTVNFLLSDRHAAEELPAMTVSMNNPAINHYALFTGEPLVVFNPIHASSLADSGYSKDDVKRYFHEHCRFPIDQMSPRHAERRQEMAGGVVDRMAPMVPNWQDYMIVVAGGHGGLHTTFMPSFGEPRSITREIREP